MEQGVEDANRIQAGELFDRQNPVASSDPNKLQDRLNTLRNVANAAADNPELLARGQVKDVPGVTDVTPSTTTEEVDEMEFMSPASDRFKGQGSAPFAQDNMMQAQTYGGVVSPEALANAVNLINMAFGGNIPIATGGIELNKRLMLEKELEKLKAQEGAGSSGTVDIAQDQGFKIDEQALGQGLMNQLKQLLWMREEI